MFEITQNRPPTIVLFGWSDLCDEIVGVEKRFLVKNYYYISKCYLNMSDYSLHFFDNDHVDVKTSKYLVLTSLFALLDFGFQFYSKFSFSIFSKTFSRARNIKSIIKIYINVMNIIELEENKRIIFLNSPIRESASNFGFYYLCSLLDKLNIEYRYLRESYTNTHLLWRKNWDRSSFVGTRYLLDGSLKDYQRSIALKNLNLFRMAVRTPFYGALTHQSERGDRKLSSNEISRRLKVVIPMMKLGNSRGLLLGFDSSIGFYRKMISALVSSSAIDVSLVPHPLNKRDQEVIRKTLVVDDSVTLRCESNVFSEFEAGDIVIGGPSHSVFQAFFFDKPAICLSETLFLERSSNVVLFCPPWEFVQDPVKFLDLAMRRRYARAEIAYSIFREVQILGLTYREASAQFRNFARGTLSVEKRLRQLGYLLQTDSVFYGASE